jgi:hypothetical protein
MSQEKKPVDPGKPIDPGRPIPNKDDGGDRPPVPPPKP